MQHQHHITPLKICIISRATLFTARGGDTIQVAATAQHLNEMGIKAEIKRTDEPIHYEAYDLLHFFNITRPADILCHITRSKKPFVISTILVDYSEFDQKYRSGFSGMLFRWLSADAIEYCKTVGRKIVGRDQLMSFSYYWNGHRKSIHKILSRAAMLLPNSHSEYQRIQHKYPNNTEYKIIPNGIDPSIFNSKVKPEKDETLVLCVGRIEGVKNQLNLIRALRHTKFRLILIGAPALNQPSYYKKCIDAATDNIQFIDHLPQEQLVAYYQRAKVHVLPSWFETTGLSSLEAAAMGCNIVVADKGDTRDYFGHDAFYCDPSSPSGIHKAIVEAATSPVNPALREKILKDYTWQQATQQTMQAYKTVLKA